MLPEKLRDALEPLRHITRPDNLYTGFINRMHVDSRATLFLQFSGETDMVGVMVCEQDVRDALGRNAQPGQIVYQLATIGNHARVHDQAGITVENERHARGHMVAVDRPGVDDMKRGGIVHLARTA